MGAGSALRGGSIVMPGGELEEGSTLLELSQVLKGETAGVWVLNVQLAGMSVLIASCSLLFSHYERSALPPLLAMHCAAAV